MIPGETALRTVLKLPGLIGLFCLGQVSLWAVQFTMPTGFSPLGACLAGCALGLSSATAIQSVVLCFLVGLCSALIHVASFPEAAVVLLAGLLGHLSKSRWPAGSRLMPWFVLILFSAAFLFTLSGFNLPGTAVPPNAAMAASMKEGTSFYAALRANREALGTLRPLPTIFAVWGPLSGHLRQAYNLVCLLLLLASFLIARKCFGEETSVFSPLILAPCLLAAQWNGGYAEVENWGVPLLMLSVFFYLKRSELLSALYFTMALSLKETLAFSLLGPIMSSFRTSRLLLWLLTAIPLGLIWFFNRTRLLALGLVSPVGWQDSLNMGMEPFRMLWTHCTAHAGEFHVFLPAALVLGLLGLLLGTGGHDRLFVLGIILGESLGFFLVSAPLFYHAFLAVMPLVLTFAPGVAGPFPEGDKRTEVFVLEKKVYR